MGWQLLLEQRNSFSSKHGTCIPLYTYELLRHHHHTHCWSSLLVLIGREEQPTKCVNNIINNTLIFLLLLSVVTVFIMQTRSRTRSKGSVTQVTPSQVLLYVPNLIGEHPRPVMQAPSYKPFCYLVYIRPYRICSRYIHGPIPLLCPYGLEENYCLLFGCFRR